MLSRFTLVLVHLAGNALLLWLGYCWLGMDESDVAHLLRSLGVAAVILLAFAWLHGFALAGFSGLSGRGAAVRSLFKLIPVTALCLLAVAVYIVLVWAESRDGRTAFVIASFLTVHLRMAVPPGSIRAVFHVIVLALEWGVVPAALLSLAARIMPAGPIGRRDPPLWRRSFFLFAVVVAALLFGGIWVPLKLFFWIPEIRSFNGQLASLLFRVGAGYLLFVSCLLVLDFITASGRPADTQPKTVG